MTTTGKGDFDMSESETTSTSPTQPYVHIPPISTDKFAKVYGAPLLDEENANEAPFGNTMTMASPSDLELHVVPQNSDASGSWEQLQEVSFLPSLKILCLVWVFSLVLCI